MKRLGQRDVQYINRTYRRTGSLWEGRFRSSLKKIIFWLAIVT
jgi:putative transposase